MPNPADPTAEHARAAAESKPTSAPNGLPTSTPPRCSARRRRRATRKRSSTSSTPCLDDVFARFPGVENVLGSALVSHEEKDGPVGRRLRRASSRRFLDFLKVLSRHGRLDCLRPVRRQARIKWTVCAAASVFG